jgi:large subunit ribosomal protein L30
MPRRRTEQKKITVTWKKSGIGYPRDQRRTIASLGLRKLNQVVEHDDTPVIRGMVNKVRHLVEVAEPD